MPECGDIRLTSVLLMPEPMNSPPIRARFNRGYISDSADLLSRGNGKRFLYLRAAFYERLQSYHILSSAPLYLGFFKADAVKRYFSIQNIL